MVKKIFKFKQGAVSIFVVIFTSLLIGLIALAFIRLMILGQRRALNSDLADSAYDSALAGLEDAKRAIIEYERNICANDAAKCRELANNVLNGNNCDAIQHILGGDKGKEVPIAKKGGSNALDQAYTCVKIKYFTDNYVRDLKQGAGEQVVLPLNVNKNMDSMRLQWHSPKDSANNSYTLDAISGNDLYKWPNAQSWGSKPPVLMVQLIKKGASDPKTLYLRPVAGGVSEADFGADDSSFKPDKAPVIGVHCQKNKSPYECSLKLNGLNIQAGDRETFLRVTKIYDTQTTINFDPNTSDTPDVTRFNGIQPEIDVTGRANHIFRRVKARVEFTIGLFPYPSAALHVGGNICKSFEMTDYRLKNDKSFTPDGDDHTPECFIDK